MQGGGRYQIAVDVGGTFTDGVLLEVETNRIFTGKTLTTYADPGQGIAEAISAMIVEAEASDPGFAAAELRRIVHGTTLIANTLIQRTGARTALVTTTGMGDCLEIRRELRYATYDLGAVYPEPLVAARDRFEVSERLGPTGEVWTPLDEAGMRGVARTIGDGGYAAVAVCFLHACVDDAHERRAAEILAETLPGVAIATSSEVAREIGEYERMSTVAANAYVQPIVERYVGLLDGKFEALGLRATLDIMVSNGAFTKADIAKRFPIRLLESGPAGGVLSAVNCAMTEGFDRLLAFDMGGTTAKACVAAGHAPAITHVFEFGRVRRFCRGSGLPAVAPSIDLIEIGAGGGSIAALNQLGLLKVGPQSAGSEPGPACYGLGGGEPTVTDADLLLGHLDPDGFLGGRMKLDVGAARRALAALGDGIGLSVEETAWGIHDIVNENMAAAARTHIAEKGFDARDFVMVATGGAGPVHAVDVARRLRIRKIVCPIASGVGSCLGFLAAPARADRAWSKVEPVEGLDRAVYEARIAEARAAIAADMAACGVAGPGIRWRLSAEVRYAGQGASVEVLISQPDIAPFDAGALADLFEAAYAGVFGSSVPGGVPEVVTWRLTGESEKTVRRYSLAGAPAERADPVAERRIFLPAARDFGSVPVYERHGLAPGTLLTGPLILAEPESTLVVAYESRVSVLASRAVEVALAETPS